MFLMKVPILPPALQQLRFILWYSQVGFGKDFQASRNIHNDVGKNFRLLGSFLVEAVKRNGSPLRQFSRSPV